MVNRTEIDLLKVAPVVRGEDPVADVKAVAERVDRVLTALKDQMKNFEAADAAELGGVPASSVISGANSMYFQTFENDIEEDWNLRSGSIAAITYPNNGRAGGRALRTTSKAVWLADNVNIPFDPSRLYRIRTRLRKVSGTTRAAYVGVEGIGADGTTIVDRSGGTTTGTGQNIVGASGSIAVTTTWFTYEGYFKGTAATGTGSSPSTDASAPRTLHENTRYIRPFFALSQGGDDGVYEIDYITLEVLTETSEVNKILTEAGGRSVTTIAGTVGVDGVITEDNVDGTSVAAGSIGGGGETKSHIIAGSIVANDITVATLSAISASMGTIFAGTLNNLETTPTMGIRLDSSSTKPASWTSYIDFAASGSDPIFKFPGIEITTTQATFSGALSAATGSFSGELSAVTGSIGGWTIGSGELYSGSYFKLQATNERILIGAASAPMTGAGVFLGKDSSDYEFRVGDPSANYMHWDGTNLIIDTNYLTGFVRWDGSTLDLSSSATIRARDFRIWGLDLFGDRPDDLYIGRNTNVDTHGPGMLIKVDDASASSGFEDGIIELQAPGGVTVTGALTVTGAIEIDGAFNHDGSTYGLCGVAPSAPDSGWAAFDNSGTRRTGDASSISTANLAQIVDTLIRQLVAKGLLSDVT